MKEKLIVAPVATLFCILTFAIYCSGSERLDGPVASSKPSLVPSAILKDLRDGNEYKVVQIGNQVWMAENLRYASENSYCYKNKEENCVKYGRLYINNILTDSTLRVCPAFFHIPTRDDWDSLFHVFKDSQKAGRFLKSANGWRFSKNGEDLLDFNVIPVPEDTVEANRLRGTKSCFWGSFGKDAVLRCFDLSDSIRNRPQYGVFEYANIDEFHPVRCVFTPPVEERTKPAKARKRRKYK